MQRAVPSDGKRLQERHDMAAPTTPFIAEFADDVHGRAGVNISLLSGSVNTSGYTLTIYQRSQANGNLITSSAPLASGTMFAGNDYLVIDHIFYDFFDVSNAWYYNDEADLGGTGSKVVALVLKYGAQIVDTLGDPASATALLPSGGHLVRNDRFGAAAGSYEAADYSPIGTPNWNTFTHFVAPHYVPPTPSDLIAPTVFSSVPVDALPGSAASEDFTVTFSEAVTGVSAAAFTLVKPAGGAGSISGVTAVDGSHYIVHTTGLSGDGGFRIDVASSGSAVTDLAGNALSGSFTGSAYTRDATPPALLSVERLLPSAEPTNAASLTFRVTFSEALQAIGPAAFTVSGTTAAVSSVTANGAPGSYDVTVSGGDLASVNGAVALGFAGGTTLSDPAGNILVSTVPTGRDDRTYQVDHVRPAAAATPISARDIDSSGAYTEGDQVSFAFSEAVDASQVTLANLVVSGGHGLGSGATLQAASPGAFAAAYTLTLGADASLAAGDLLSFSAANVEDQAGNLAAGSVAFLAPVGVPSISGSPAVAGNPAQGEVLNASTGSLVDQNGHGAITFQWQTQAPGQAWSDVAGATGAAYTATQDDVGRLVRVAASYTDGLGRLQRVASNPTAAVLNVNDLPTGAITVSGTPIQGQALVASNTLADIDGMGQVGYAWQRDDGQGGWTDIAGAVDASYVPVQADVGHVLRAVASYVDLGGTAESVASNPTAAVLNVNDLPTGSVLVSGTSNQGLALTASNTLADIDGMGQVGYAWQRDDGQGGWTDIAGAVDASYVPVQADVGHLLRAVASYTDGQGTAERAASGPTAAVTAFPTFKDVRVSWDAAGATLGAGRVVTFTLTPTEMLRGRGAPQLELSNGGVASFDPRGFTGKAMVFSYTVRPGDTNTADLRVIGFNLNGGSFTNTAGRPIDGSGVAALPGSAPGLAIDTQAPAAPTGLAQASGRTGPIDDTAPAISGTAEAGSIVTLREADAVLGTARADAQTGAWSIVPSRLSDGTHQLVATAADAAGNVSPASAAFAVTVDTTPPAVSVGDGNIAGNIPRPVLEGPADTGASASVFVDGGPIGSTNADAATRAGTQGVVPPISQDGAIASSPLTLHALLESGYTLQFDPGTEQVKLADGVLSLGAGTQQAMIARLYNGLLGRSPDAQGIGLWNKALDSGLSAANLAEGFLNSPEYQAANAGLSDAGFVDSLYRNVLGRDGTAEEIGYYQASLQAGVSRGAIAAGFARSIEAQNAWSGATNGIWVPDPDAQLTAFTYQAAFGRTPGADEIQYWVGVLHQGVSAQEFATAVVSSSEFAAVQGGRTGSDLITAFYMNGLGRAPSASDLATMNGAMQAGSLDAAGLLLTVAQSPEAFAHLGNAS